MSLMSSPVAGSGRVPVEHRLLGMDKRSFPYALFVIGVFVAAIVIIPLIDRVIPWDDPVAAGDRLALSSTIAFTPTTGWNVENGFRLVGDGPATQSGEATVVGDGVTFAIVPGAFHGSPAQLLNQVATVTSSTDDSTFRVDGTPSTFTTSSGAVGVIRPYSSVQSSGIVAAFVIDGTGLEVTATGRPEQLAAAAPEIDAMISSIHRTAS